jgi:hypothetical protein
MRQRMALGVDDAGRSGSSSYTRQRATPHATLKALGAEGESRQGSTYLTPPAGEVGTSRRVLAGGEGAAGVDSRILGLRILRALPVYPARPLERLLAPLTHPAHSLFSALGEVPRVGRLAAHAEVVKVGRRGAGAGRRLVSSAAVCGTTGYKGQERETLRTTGGGNLATGGVDDLSLRGRRSKRPSGRAFFHRI